MTTALRPSASLLALRPSARLLTRRPAALRRLAHDAAHGHAAHAGPKPEAFGKSFYLTLLLIPTGYLMYSIGSSDNNFVSRGVKAYGDLRSEWTNRNALHTKMVEEAGHDKNLFINSAMPNHIELGYPEAFNGGSPYNVPAGHAANLEGLVRFYREKQFKEEREKLARQSEGN